MMLVPPFGEDQFTASIALLLQDGKFKPWWHDAAIAPPLIFGVNHVTCEHIVPSCGLET